MFQTTAIRDLNVSIERLEKARTDYRAALLWMKDVSDKLHNPDYHNQLTKYREARIYHIEGNFRGAKYSWLKV